MEVVMEWRRGVLKRWSWYRGLEGERERRKRHRGMTVREWRTSLR